jgi:DNA replicative helicase MCM subunit Mcm2 (Cdc46/Mcm family)
VEIVGQRSGAFEDDDKKAPKGVMASKHTTSPDTNAIERLTAASTRVRLSSEVRREGVGPALAPVRKSMEQVV